jgi:hypothetical protein
MKDFSEFAKKLLLDASENPDVPFDFVQVASGGWQSPYGYISDVDASIEVTEALKMLQENGLIYELVPNGCRYKITQHGISVAKQSY